MQEQRRLDDAGKWEDAMLPMRCLGAAVLLAFSPVLCEAPPAAAGPLCGGPLKDYSPYPGPTPMVATPHVYVVYWGWGQSGDPNNVKGQLEGALNGLGGTRYFGAPTGQYYGVFAESYYWFDNQPGLLRGILYDDVNPIPYHPCTPVYTQCAGTATCDPGPTSAEQAQEALYVQRALGIDPNDPNTVIYIQGPAGVQLTAPCNCAAHGAVFTTYGVPLLRFVSSSYQGLGCGGEDASVGHELTETVTDPDTVVQFDPGGNQVTSWAMTQFAGSCEIADACQLSANPSPIAPAIHVRLLPKSAPVSEFAIHPMYSNDGAACVNARASRSDNFYTGNDGAIWHQAGTTAGSVFNFANSANSWGRAVGNVTFASAPAATSWGPNRIDVFAQDTHWHLGHLYTNDGGSTVSVDDWGVIGGYVFDGKPEVTSWGASRLDVFIRAYNGVDTLFHRSWDDGTDSGWVAMSALPQSAGGMASSPAAVSPQFMNPGETSPHIDVFILGNDGNLYHASSSDGHAFGAWESWGSPPSPAVGDPDAASWGPSNVASSGSSSVRRLDVFFAAQNGSLVHRWSTSGDNTTGTWDSWARDPGVTFVGSPAAVGMGDQRVMVSAPTSNGRFSQAIWDFGWHGWTDLTAGFLPVNGSSLATW